MALKMLSHRFPRLLGPFALRRLSTAPSAPSFEAPRGEPDLDYLLNPANAEEITRNVAKRQLDLDVRKLHELGRSSTTAKGDLNAAAFAFPNRTHPAAASYGDDPVVVKTTAWSPSPGVEKARPFDDVARIVDGVRTRNLSHFTGDKTYFLLGQLAELEQALIRYSVDTLLGLGFELVSVPDLLNPAVLEACGMSVFGERTQVFRLDPHYGQVALSGTAEMALGGWFSNATVSKTRRLAAVSRCFRAETSQLRQEKGIFRVFHFTKVEMFGVTSAGESDAMLQHFLEVQDSLFSGLGLAYQILDMPPHELASAAYRKYDIEALLPGRPADLPKYGEISSCSNCTDYQSRRLNTRFLSKDGAFAHTVNGTACAVPRLIMAICEQFQTPNGCVTIPKVLRKYMRDAELIAPKPRKQKPTFKFVSSPKYFENGAKR